MPPGRFEGDVGGAFSFGAGSSRDLELATSSFAFFASFCPSLFASSRAGVPKIACLKALSAN